MIGVGMLRGDGPARMRESEYPTSQSRCSRPELMTSGCQMGSALEALSGPCTPALPRYFGWGLSAATRPTIDSYRPKFPLILPAQKKKESRVSQI